MVYASDDDQELSQQILDSFKYDLVILRGFLPKFKLNDKLFTVDYLTEHYPNLMIDVVEQTPKFFGFTNNRNNQVNWTVRDYAAYLNNQKNGRKDENNPKIKADKIYFAVNIDMDNMTAPREELRNKIHELLTFCSINDALSYIREHIRGMSIPQYYLKEDGAWTGGHEENNRIRSININHGNGDSEWYGIGQEYAKEFADHVQKTHNTNVYIKEGLWFENCNYFLKNNMKVIYGIQRPGDIMLVGPGCVHWYNFF